MRLLRLFLFGLFFFYPLYWTSQFVLYALPGLLRAVFLYQHLRLLDVTLLRATAVASDPSAGIIESTRLELLVAALTVAGLVYLFRWHRHLAGAVGIALLGQAALQPFLRAFFFLEAAGPGVVLAALVAFGVLCAGLLQILKRTVTGGFGNRLACLGVLIVLPEVIFWALLRLRYAFFEWRFSAVILGPLLLAALLACAAAGRRELSAAVPRAVEILAGATLTVFFVAGITLTGRAIDGKRLTAMHAAIDALPEAPPDAPYPKVFFQRGANFTAEYPDFYGTEGAREMLKKLPAYGVNAIALVPYGFASHDEPRVGGWDTRWESDDGVRQLARLAHALGMKVLLKPQLWLNRGNPSDLVFRAPSKRAQWFARYQVFLEHYANLAKEIHADVLCIGVELAKMTEHEADWRRLIARARELYPGPLTYAANYGVEFERIAFWDALDYIGLDEYYPLPDDLSADALVLKIEQVQRKFARPVIFTEAGFASTAEANRRPWQESGQTVDLELQVRCFEVLLRAFYDKPWFEGIYWWKVGTNGYGGPKDGSHTPWNKPAMTVIQRWYVHSSR